MVKSTFTTDDVSKICGVTIQAVIGWEKQGKLPAYKTLGGHRRITKENLIEFLNKNKIPVPKELTGDQSCRILIINTDKKFVSLLDGLIKSKYPGRALYSTTDAFEAGRRTILFKPDLVILGLKRPGLDAFKICRQIKTTPETKHIRVLAILERSSPKTQKKILNCGADFVLPENLDNEEFSKYLDGLKIK